jgi:hypothetical protein
VTERDRERERERNIFRIIGKERKGKHSMEK